MLMTLSVWTWNETSGLLVSAEVLYPLSIILSYCRHTFVIAPFSYLFSHVRRILHVIQTIIISYVRLLPDDHF
jgi:hypothetical protein